MPVHDIGDAVDVTAAVTVNGVATNATMAILVTAPNGTTSSPAIINTSVGNYKATVVPALTGTYIYRWTASVAATEVGEGRFYVKPALAASTGPAWLPWSPSLTQVADYVPTRTRPATPGAGDDTILGTFTTLTRPTGDQAGRLTDDATAYVAGVVGTVDSTLYALAAAAASQRAAAYVEYSYPERDADISVADSLLALSDATLDRLLTANLAVAGVSIGGAASLPQYSFPLATDYGDINL